MNIMEGKDKSPILVGPWGGAGGSAWDDGVFTAIRQLVVYHGAAIDSIQVEYDRKGSSVWGEKHGGQGGARVDKVKLDYPDEVLTSISGHYGPISHGQCPTLVRSLTLESNKKKYGPFGAQKGTYFSLPMSGGKIVGFHGKAGWYLDSLGVYLKPLKVNTTSMKSLLPSLSHLVNGSSNGNNMGSYNMVKAGTVAGGNDIVVAFGEKEDGNNSFHDQMANISRQTSREQQLGHSDSKSKVGAYPSAGGPAKLGPWGGNGGSIFDDGTNYNGIRQINISRNVGLTSIRVLYDKNGRAVWGSKHGGSGGIKTDKIVFDYPYEVLTHITGYYGTTLVMGPTAVKCIAFHTTKGKYGPFGQEQGMPFSSLKGEGMIVGFHGRKGWYIDGIGVHLLEGKIALPMPPPPPTNSNASNPGYQSDTFITEGRYRVVKEAVPSGPGPWGGEGGRPWDDGVYSGVKQIFLTRAEAITSIQIEYDRNGQSVWSSRHGGDIGATTHRIKFEYPNEVLNCICGYYSSIDRGVSNAVIKSLTFYTNRGKYGPFGEEVGTFFTSTTTQGKVVGFHGRGGLYLDAIGVHMQHWLGEAGKPMKSMISRLLG